MIRYWFLWKAKMRPQSLVLKIFLDFLMKWKKQAFLIQELALCHLFPLYSFATVFLLFQ